MHPPTPNSERPRENRRFDVLAVSDMCVDLVLYGNVRPQFHQVEQLVDNYALEVGGSANIFISQLAKLGAKAGVIGWVGRDSFGEFLISNLNSAGVDTTNVRSHPTLKTGIGVALAEPGDRAILTYLGTIDATAIPDLLPDLIHQTQHWHLASYFLLQSLRPFWKEWLSRCKENGVTTSLDTNWDPQDRWDGVLDLLPLIDVFLPNEEEACRLTGEKDCSRAAEKLAGYGPLIVVKRGAKGALARKGTQEWELRPDKEEIDVADSIGAGDNFDAGFLRAQMLGWSVERSLELGHRCAAASLSETGGFRGQLRETTFPGPR